MRIPDSQLQSTPSENALPQALQFMLTSIESTLRQSFSSKPPHTIQRLAELVLRPARHYRTLPAYLRAVDRVVSVSSGADIFPLPLSVPPSATIDGTLSNGVNGAATNYSLFNDTGLGSDESLGGALLTPIPWLSNVASPPTSEHGLSHPGPSADPANVEIPVENEGGSQNAPPETTDKMEAKDGAEEDDDSVPHARGPSIIGVEDMGLQDGKDVQMTLLPADSDVTTKDQPAEETQSGKNGSVGHEEDGDGDIVIDDVPAASGAQKDIPSPAPSSEVSKPTSTEADAPGDGSDKISDNTSK